MTGTRSTRSGGHSAAVPCRHFPACIGCPLIGTPYAEQLAGKNEGLRAALAARVELAAIVLEAPVGSPRAIGYRNHAKLVFRERYRRDPPPGREVILGVYRPGTHSVMPAEACIVHDRHLQPILRSLRESVEAMGIPVFDERARQGLLRYALARASTVSGKVHLTLVSASAATPKLDALVRELRRRHPELESTFLCVNPTAGNTLLSSDVRRLFGPPALVERFGALFLESRPDAFVQTNPVIAARIYDTAAGWLAPEKSDTALDLYCGVGALALRVAPLVDRVVGIEASPSAIACAAANATRNGIRNAAFVTGDAADAVRLAAGAGIASPSLVLVNPPRRGLSPEARRALAKLAPRRILYVSCDPRTLARDLADLAGAGYRTRRVRAFDMLPQTPHVEALALAEREA